MEVLKCEICVYKLLHNIQKVTLWIAVTDETQTLIAILADINDQQTKVICLDFWD